MQRSQFLSILNKWKATSSEADTDTQAAESHFWGVT